MANAVDSTFAHGWAVAHGPWEDTSDPSCGCGCVGPVISAGWAPVLEPVEPPASCGGGGVATRRRYTDDGEPVDETFGDPTDLTEIVFGCVVGTDTLCDHPYDEGGTTNAVISGQTKFAVLPSSVHEMFEGPWSTCERAVMEAAWGLLAANTDLVRWALCKATGDPNAGACIEVYLLGLDRVDLVLKGEPCINPFTGDADFSALTFSPGVSWGDLVFAAGWLVATGTGLGLDVPLVQAAVTSRPQMWWCNLPVSRLGTAARLFCEGAPNDQECAVVSLASGLLHELTHVCWRSYKERPGDCEASYLTANYFAWAAQWRFPNATASSCCGATFLPDPATDDMSEFFHPTDDCLSGGAGQGQVSVNGAGWAGTPGGSRGDSPYADIDELPPGFDSVTPPTAAWVALSESPDRATDPVQTLAIAAQQGPTL